MFEKCIQLVIDWIHSFIKVTTHWYTGKCEIERVCLYQNDGRHTTTMTVMFANTVRQSKQLTSMKGRLFQSKPFSVQQAQRDLIETNRVQYMFEKCIIQLVVIDWIIHSVY